MFPEPDSTHAYYDHNDRDEKHQTRRITMAHGSASQTFSKTLKRGTKTRSQNLERGDFQVRFRPALLQPGAGPVGEPGSDWGVGWGEFVFVRIG